MNNPLIFRPERVEILFTTKVRDVIKKFVSKFEDAAKEPFLLSPNLKSKIDLLRNKFWTAGITNPLGVIEQITYLLFLKRPERLDEERKTGKSLLMMIVFT